jgi:hypothetical protein
MKENLFFKKMKTLGLAKTCKTIEVLVATGKLQRDKGKKFI